MNIDKIFESKYFWGVRLFVAVFIYYFLMPVIIQNGFGQTIELSYLQKFQATYLTFSLTAFYPFLLSGLIFQGEKPLNPIGFIASFIIFTIILKLLISLFKKLLLKFNIHNFKKIERNLFINVVDSLFLIAAIIILAYPFFVEMDFF